MYILFVKCKMSFRKNNTKNTNEKKKKKDKMTKFEI